MKAMIFTEWVYPEREADEWYRWFMERGVPAAVISQNGGSFGTRYAVLRQGKVRQQTVPKDVKILRECNGFVR